MYGLATHLQISFTQSLRPDSTLQEDVCIGYAWHSSCILGSGSLGVPVVVSVQGASHIRRVRCDGRRRRDTGSCSTIGHDGSRAYANVYASVVFLVRLTARVFSLCRIMNIKTDETTLLIAPEAILESPRNGLQVAHAASTSRLSALGLLAPLIRPELRPRVAALSAFYKSVSGFAHVRTYGKRD